MAKRKRGGKAAVDGADTTASGSAKIQAESSRKRIRTYEDVADSDDEFHLNQDKILLEEDPTTKRRRRVQEQEEFLDQSDEEVLGDGPLDSEEEEVPPSPDRDEDEVEGEDEDELDDGWRTSNMYGADEIETEEQAIEEEAEARRLQKKQLQSMSAADYGFDEDDWQTAEQESSTKATITEVLPETVSEDMSPVERLKMLRSRYPEFEPLRKELLAMQDTCKDLAARVEEGTNAVAKHRAATAYTGSLAMYFALLTSNHSSGKQHTAMAAAKLRDHGIMSMLVECRATWQAAQTLPLDPAPAPIPSAVAPETQPLQTAMKSKAVGKEIKSRKERHADAVQAAKAARIQEQVQRTEASFGDLDELLAPSKKSKTRPATTAQHDDFDLGESTLSAAQAEEKARKRKSLRFYTSQIAQKVNKRGNAGRNAGGDDDVPHRERLRDRQARLNAEAEKRGKTRADLGDDLGGVSDDDDAQQAREIRDEDDGYYDLVSARAAKKKSEKSALAEARQQAEAEGGRVVEEETIDQDGKRKINYLIEKNKGLAPQRRNQIRNPRVKKRKKFEQKSKKLASMKPIYKGGEGRGGYGGELTGIKANLVKSTKL